VFCAPTCGRNYFGRNCGGIASPRAPRIATPANLAAKQIITQKPIVMVAVADQWGRADQEPLPPGGNINGRTNIAAELAGKRLEILKECSRLLQSRWKALSLEIRQRFSPREVIE